jgi:hypothetical protein
MKPFAWAGLVAACTLPLLGCAAKAPTAPCTGVIHTSLEHNSCDPTLWHVPIDVFAHGHRVGSIQPDTADFGPFTFTAHGRNEKPWLELRVGKRQLAETTLFCDGGERQDFLFKAWHIEAFSNEPWQGPCEGVNCLSKEREIKNGPTCTSEFVLMSR